MQRLAQALLLSALLGSSGCLFTGTTDFSCTPEDQSCPEGQTCDVAAQRCVPTGSDGGGSDGGGSDGGGCVSQAGDCNDIDDDCDGSTDEADELDGAGDCPDQRGVCLGQQQLCEQGAWAGCDVAGYEDFETLCDALDNDCDGSVDNSPAGGQLVQTCGGTLGVCEEGFKSCTGGLWGACSGVEPSTELCDGFDNDCDGQADIGIAPIACPLDEGVCANALVACLGGVFGSCQAAYGNNYELTESTCDARDNDCDGEVDMDAAGAPLLRLCAEQRGVCAGATTQCFGGGYPTCDASSYTTNSGDYDASGDASCDGLDNDCDGETDEDFVGASDCHPSAPEGVCAGSTSVCLSGVETCPDPAGYQAVETFCDGLDNDCDGNTDTACGCTFGVSPPQACSLNEGACTEGTQPCLLSGIWDDCSTVTPTSELCDAIDNDCDGSTDEDFGVDAACSAGVGGCEVDGIIACVDPQNAACTAIAGTPGTEVCDGNSVDDDCDGATDEDVNGDPLTQDCPLTQGVCAASLATCVGGSFATCAYGDDYEVVEISCDGFDNDCDGLLDSADSLPSEFCANQTGVCNGSTKACGGTSGWSDCGQPRYFAHDARYEDVSETSCDGVDNDCDGLTDERADNNTLTRPCASTVGVCATAYEVCSGGAYGSCVYPATYQTTETLCDGLDNDCDGMVDSSATLICNCVTGQTQDCPLQQGVCQGQLQTCDAVGNWSVCNYGGAFEQTEVSCDGLDNDCDGGVDEDAGGNPVSRLCPQQNGVCAGSQQRCTAPNTWTACDYGAHSNFYENPEFSCDQQDNDCDNIVDGLAADAGCFQGTSCQFGLCGATACLLYDRPTGFVCGVGCKCEANGVPAEAVCDDGIDNDQDSLTDCADPDCATEPICIPRCGDAHCNPLVECNVCQECADATACGPVGCGGTNTYCDIFAGECGRCSECSSDPICGSVSCAVANSCDPRFGQCSMGCPNCANHENCGKDGCDQQACQPIANECSTCAGSSDDCWLMTTLCSGSSCTDGRCAPEIGECADCAGASQDCESNPVCTGFDCNDGICNPMMGECIKCIGSNQDCRDSSNNIALVCLLDAVENCFTAGDFDEDGLQGCNDPDCAGTSCGFNCTCVNGRCTQDSTGLPCP